MSPDTPYPLKMRDTAGNVADEIGTVTFDAAGQIAVDGIPEELASVVRRMVADLNSRKAVSITVPGGPGSAQYALETLHVRRSDPGLLPAMARLMDQTYGLVVVYDEDAPPLSDLEAVNQ